MKKKAAQINLRWSCGVFIFVLFSTLVASFPLARGLAQAPCPGGGPCDQNLPQLPEATITGNPAAVPPAPVPEGFQLSDYLKNLTLYAVETRNAFIRGVESDLGGYFFTVAYWLCWVLALGFLVRTSLTGGWEAAAVGRYTAWMGFCFVMLIWCGDVDGDGIRGDAINRLMAAGNSFAYGYQGTDASGSYLGRAVEKQQQDFDANYQKFVENKMLVKVNGQDLPVKYPGNEGLAELAAIYTGKASDNPVLMKKIESQEWRMSLMFEFLNVGRAALSGIDFFLLMLQGFLVITLRLAAPFMVAAAFDKSLAQKISLNFFWSVLVVTLVFPVITQLARYLAYYAGNMGLGINPTQPYFSYDPTTGAFIAKGDPTYVIAVAGVLMIFGCFILLFSLAASYKLMQGAIVEAISSSVSTAFTTLSSIGMSAAVGAWATRLAVQAERQQIEENYKAQVTGAEHSKLASEEMAKTSQATSILMADEGMKASLVRATAQANSSNINAFGGLQSGIQSIEAERTNSVNSALTSYRHSLATMSLEKKKEIAGNYVDLLSKNEDATSKLIAKAIEQEPEKLDLLAEQYENWLKGMPVVSSVANALGVNKDAFNNWLRSGNNSLGATIFKSMLGEASAANKTAGNVDLGLSPGNLVYTRPDGTAVDAMTGRVMSNNIIDLTNPKQPVDYGKTPSVGQIFAGGATGGMTKKQKDNMANLKGLIKQDPNFLPTLQRESWKRGINPNDMLNMLAIESSFRKDVINNDGYLGLGQVGSAERRSLGNYGWTGNNATDLARVKSMTASQQLEKLVFPFVDKKFGVGTKGLTMDKLYAGWGSGHYSNDPNYVHMENGGKRNTAYDKNPQWDVNRDGKVQQWEFGASAPKNLGAGIYFDANQALGQIRAVDAPTAKVVAKKLGADFDYHAALRNNQMVFEGRNQITSEFYAGRQRAETQVTEEQISNANTFAQMKAQGLHTQYNYQLQSSATLLGGEKQAAQINQQASHKAANLTYQGQMNAAQITLDGQLKVAKIIRDSSLEASQTRAVSQMIQQIGQSVVHHVAEAPERVMRF